MRHTACESFGPDKVLVGLWVLLSAIPIPIAIAAVSLGRPDAFEVLVASLLAPAAVLVFAARFRATFTSDRFVYRHWGATIDVAYVDLAHIEVTNVTPIQNVPVRAFLVTRDGYRHPFWPKLFPSGAAARFFQLAPRQD